MTISPAKRAETLVKARAVFKASGLNPHKRALQKIEQATVWIYRHGYTSPGLLREMMGVESRSGIANRLVKMGLAKLTDIEGGGLIKGVPRRLVTLTYAGVALAASLTESCLNYQTEPYKAIGKMELLRHNMLVQFLTLRELNLENQSIDGYESERELRASNELSTFNRAAAKRAKIPDAIWLYGDDRIALELELTPKRGNSFHTFASGLIAGMPTDDPETMDYEVTTTMGLQRVFVRFKKHRWDHVYIITPTEHLKNNYIRELAAGKHVDRWESLNTSGDSARSNAMRHFRHVITEDEADRFSVYSLEDAGF